MKGIKKHTHRDRNKTIREILPLIQEYFDDNLVALAAQGSYARGDDTDYSDLELIAFLERMPEDRDTQGMSLIKDGMLIELQWTTRQLYISEVKEPAEEWHITGSDVLLPLINEEFIVRLNNYKVEDLKKKCLKQVIRHWPEVQESVTKLLNAIEQENREGLPILVFHFLSETLKSLSFLNQTPFTTIARYITEVKSFRLKPESYGVFLDIVNNGRYADLQQLSKAVISIFEELEEILTMLNRNLYDDSLEIKIKRNW
jgi:hypothetical protein